MLIPCSLQVWGEIALLQKAHQTTDTQGEGQDCTANHEFEVPAPWCEGFLETVVVATTFAHALWIMAMPISSLSHCRGLLSPTLYVISQRMQWAILHH